MTSELFGVAAAYGAGVLTGLWLGFKIWRQDYIRIVGQPRSGAAWRR